jgi:hypothetical protein
MGAMGFSRHADLQAAAVDGVLISLGWGFLGLVAGALFGTKSLGAFSGFNLGAISGLTLSSLLLVTIAFGWE